MDRAFWLKRKLHLFRTEDPIGRASFTGPQFAKGIACFPVSSNPMVRVERVRALLKSAGAAELAYSLNGIRVSAEAEVRGGRRMDLLLEWTESGSNRYAVAVEAKLGRHVAGGQVPACRRHLKKIADDRRLAVVSTRRSGKTEKSQCRKRDWRWMSRHDLPVAHECSLADECEDRTHLEFRRAILDQTG